VTPEVRAAERIRVLWLIKGLGPGGAERLLVAAAELRDRVAFDYRAAYLLPWKDHLVGELESAGVPVRCLGTRDERDVRWAARLRSLLVESPVDVVHVHSPYVAGIARLVIRTLPARMRPRVVATEHNAWSTYTATTRWLNAATSGLDDATITVSGEVKGSLRGRAAGRAVVIAHGIPLEHVRSQRAARASARDELGVSPDTVLLGTVANYVPKKDYPNLLHAARRLAERRPDVRWCAVGQGPMAESVHALRHELGLADVVRLPGYRPDAVRLMAACDVFVLASRFEGLPVALMEACALGLPVVVTAVGGIPEAIEDGVQGRLVPPERPDLLADAIEELIVDPARRAAMADAAAALAENYDAARAVREIEAIYRRVSER
jgi:glycosyltransferase involved in cell wall biosynthesis